MCFHAPNRHEVEKNFTRAALIEDAVKESGRTRIEKFGLDERIFFVEGIEEPLDVFDAGRSIPNERAFFFCPLHELGGVTFLAVRVYWKPNLKDQNQNQYTPHRTTSLCGSSIPLASGYPIERGVARSNKTGKERSPRRVDVKLQLTGSLAGVIRLPKRS